MFTVYDGIDAYARKANSALYLACRTAIFNNPANQIYTPKGKVTKVRQYESGMAGNYSKSKGWLTQYGTGKGVEWIDYKAEFDRAKILMTDAIDEEQSFAVGMTPSIELLNADFLDNQLPREIDATNIAKWYSQIPLSNRYTNTQLDISVDGILETLNTLDRFVFNSGYDRDTVLFMSAEAYSNMISAIQNKMGLANSALMRRTASVAIDTGLGGLISGAENVITVDITFEVYGRFLIVRVPDDRMYTQLIMYSGDPDDEGQEAGGYVPDYTNANFAQVQLMAIPIEAAFTNVRYMIDNFLYPSWLQVNSYTKVDLRDLNKRMYGNVEIMNAGINQKGANFEYDIRAIYGGSLFDNRARNCFVVTGAVGAQKLVTGITLSGAGGATTVAVGSSLNISATVAPADAANKNVVYSVTNGTGEASITQGGVLTGVSAGTVTVTATAVDGSNVKGNLAITVTAQVQ